MGSDVQVRIPDRRVAAGERNKMKLERIEEMIDPQDMYLCRPMIEVVDVSDWGEGGDHRPMTKRVN